MTAVASLDSKIADWCREDIAQALLDISFIENGGRLIARDPRTGEHDITATELAARSQAVEALRELLAHHGLSEVPPGLVHGGRTTDG